MSAPLVPLEIGAGQIEREGSVVRFVLTDASERQYSDAQLYDYRGLRRRHYPWRPPLRMTVRAWASHRTADLRGTAGFGFWNQPFMPGQPLPRLPRYLWFFFGGAPHNMAFARDVPGAGWKAAAGDFNRLPFLILAPFAPLGFLLMRSPALYHTLWPLAQRAIGVAEALVSPEYADLCEPHTYRLDWLPRAVRFYVDDRLVLGSTHAPRGPLGFVAWMDNQYMIITPQGGFGWGMVSVPGRQWLAIEGLRIEQL